MIPAPPSSLELISKIDTSPMAKYEIVDKISEGTFGIVSKAIIKDNKDAGFFALKTKRNEDFKGIITMIDFNEIKCLHKLKKEKNFVRLIELVKDKENFGMVLEYCRVDLRKILHFEISGMSLPITDKKNMILQLFTGIRAMHSIYNIMHRDLKPSNILLSMDGTLKIADFGYSIEMSNNLPELSTNIGTIWYMSPEICLGHGYYNQSTDIWSAGCIAVDFFTRKCGLFQGKDKLNQMEKISELCGFCSESVWPEAKGFPNYNHFHEVLGKYTQNKLHEYLMKVTRHSGAANFLGKLLKLNATQRISADQAVNDVYFQSAPSPTPDLSKLLKALDIGKIY